MKTKQEELMYSKARTINKQLIRDRKCCERCGCVENLEIHHITKIRDGWTNDIDNLILLCRECHRGVLGIHGKQRRGSLSIENGVLVETIVASEMHLIGRVKQVC